ncbi:hypothetical protein C7H81_05835 [Bacillus subtilis]|nr:hypothetical protein CVV77_02865 [Bacillus sp. SN1]PSI06483.1 hypothetical protein C7H81_05835 [Bacillus subtilis]
MSSLKVIIDLYCFFSTNMYNEKQKTPDASCCAGCLFIFKSYLRALFQSVFYSGPAQLSAVFYIVWQPRNL